MASYTITAPAYFKLFFHISKHPHRQVNGVLLGKEESPGKITVEDAIPLLHNWTSLSPMMEIGLDMATQYAASSGQKIVAYYQASERLDDTALAPVGEKVASKIKDGFPQAVAFVLDGDKLGTGQAALIPYISQTGGNWRQNGSAVAPFSPGSPYQLSSSDIPTRAVTHVKEEHLHHAFGDFDDHLEDVTIDWLRNSTCLPAVL
ncbi:UPF0172-domain-containing protein [Pluteus cervinus]|uniref:UPF0172-domain-containing protein n=1 Tax=Pluteus cervinus TaxID=181527 RepID=A0ACD3AW39_9AGAR|nr:UPF0172-domain-containing protein [Pluteus cervinus]